MQDSDERSANEPSNEPQPIKLRCKRLRTATYTPSIFMKTRSAGPGGRKAGLTQGLEGADSHQPERLSSGLAPLPGSGGDFWGIKPGARRYAKGFYSKVPSNRHADLWPGREWFDPRKATSVSRLAQLCGSGEGSAIGQFFSSYGPLVAGAAGRVSAFTGPFW